MCPYLFWYKRGRKSPYCHHLFETHRNMFSYVVCRQRAALVYALASILHHYNRSNIIIACTADTHTNRHPHTHLIPSFHHRPHSHFPSNPGFLNDGTEPKMGRRPASGGLPHDKEPSYCLMRLAIFLFLALKAEDVKETAINILFFLVIDLSNPSVLPLSIKKLQSPALISSL